MKVLLTLLFTLGIVSGMTAQVNAGIAPDMVQCDLNNPGDQMEVFDLTSQDPFIINGQQNVVVSYHPTSGDALGGSNPITNADEFTNIVNPQTIFARLQSTAGQGSSISAFELIVPVRPVIDQAPLELVVEDPEGDDEAVFDLTLNEPLMLGEADPFEWVFIYFTSASDAQDNTNAIEDPEAFTNSVNPQPIFGRYEPIIQQCEVVFFDFSIRAESTLGTADDRLIEAVVFPNPAGDWVNVSVPNGDRIQQISLFDIQGRLIRTWQSVSGPAMRLQLQGLQTGQYLLEVKKDNRSHVSRLLISD